jgi:hypothetical protein
MATPETGCIYTYRRGERRGQRCMKCISTKPGPEGYCDHHLTAFYQRPAYPLTDVGDRICRGRQQDRSKYYEYLIPCTNSVINTDGFCYWCVQRGHQASRNQGRCNVMMTSGPDEGYRCLNGPIRDGYCLYCLYNEPVAKTSLALAIIEPRENIDASAASINSVVHDEPIEDHT